MKKQVFVVVLMLLLGGVSFAQQAAVVIKSEHENQLFQANINNFLLNKTPVNQLKVNGLIPQGKYYLEIRFANDTSVLKTQVNIVDVGFYHLYKVNDKGIHLKKIAPDYQVEEPNQLVVKYGAQAIDTAKVDTVLKTDTMLVDTTDHYQMPDYYGKVGCPWPLKDDEFAAFKLNLNNQRLEDDKLAYCKEYLANQCLIAKHVAEVLAVFEYEETKLAFAKFIYPRTFDLDNFLPETRKHFKFENSVDQLIKEFKINGEESIIVK
ncbi:MAG: DUF4476 domain-containing protein [Flavobacteriales bacterium]